MEENNNILNFVKALADANRLKIVGLLARRPYSGEELAALLDLKPSTVSHHLSKLVKLDWCQPGLKDITTSTSWTKLPLKITVTGFSPANKWLPLPLTWTWMPTTVK